MEEIIKNYVLPNILSANMWEFYTKLLFKEIIVRFSNDEKRENIFLKMENSLEKLVAHFKMTIYFKMITSRKIKFNSSYVDIDVNHILKKLENLNAEAQVYYNTWVTNMQKVEIAKATKDVVEVRIL